MKGITVAGLAFFPPFVNVDRWVGAGVCAALSAASVALAGCGSERYARPAGPAPRYESAPLPAWDGGRPPGSPSASDQALQSEIDRALADAGP